MTDKRKSRISLAYYFRQEKKFLTLTAITGIIYNVGMTAGPWFEGQLAQYLYDILKGVRRSRDLVVLSLIYVAVIAVVQGARALKRLYVRKFANDVTLSMKESIFHHIVSESYAEIQSENTGAVMTKAIADAETCAEGMRKFTTEIFDTGVVMIAYLVMLLLIDWRLTLMVIIFPPIAYAASASLKKRVTDSSAASKAAMSRLNGAAVDMIGNALTYRIYGEESNKSAAYEDVLTDYEHKNASAGVWQNSPQPVYLVISMIGVIPILYFGGRNVLGTGWDLWTIAKFSSFLSCFTKLATKSSHAANLFNAVQKAQVSWKRIRDYLSDGSDDLRSGMTGYAEPAELRMEHVSFEYRKNSDDNDESDGGDGHLFCLRDLNLTADPGEIIGITGRVASGKSTFGRIFLNEYPYQGRILFGGEDIEGINCGIFGYAGHDPELFTGTVRENIAFAEKGMLSEAAEERLAAVLSEVQIDSEVTPDTVIGMEGNELSGGQQARIALARALYSRAPVLILDDPFAAVDADTEEKIFAALRNYEKDRIILIISHRMELFPQMDMTIYLENSRMLSGTHQQMMKVKGYRSLFELQQGGSHEEK